MDTAPPMELPAHLQRRRRRRSSAHHDERLEEKEIELLRAGVRPQWLVIHRILNTKCSAVLLLSCVMVSVHRSTRKGCQYLVKWRDLPHGKATWEQFDEDSPLRGVAEAIRSYERLK